MVQSTLSPTQLGQKTPALAYLVLTVALVSLSFTAIFIKLSLEEISANATLFNRLWMATVIFGAWNGFTELSSRDTDGQSSTPQKAFPTKAALLLVLVAVLHVVGRFFWTWSITQTSVVNATLLANTPPIFTTLGAWLILKQQFDRRFIGGMMVALMGALTLGLGDFSSMAGAPLGSSPAMGDAAALLSAVFYAASCLITEKLRVHFRAQTILLWRCLIGCGVMFPIVLSAQEPAFPITAAGWIAIVGLAVVCEGLGHGLVVYSLKFLSSSFVNVFLLLESVLTAIFAYLIFSEGLGVLNLLTFAMILGGVLIARTSHGAIKAVATSAD